MAWDDNKRAQAIQMYLDAEPTAENFLEICKDIAEELGESANGVRMILSKAKRDDDTPVYIKKEQPAKSTSSGGGKTASGGGSTRVSKENAHNQLIAAIQAHGQEADSEIISKMTGKAALHFAGIFAAIPAAE